MILFKSVVDLDMSRKYWEYVYYFPTHLRASHSLIYNLLNILKHAHVNLGNSTLSKSE